MTRAGAARAGLTAPRSEEELEERLSRPTAEVCEALSRCPGDVVILGAGGKMGPSLSHHGTARGRGAWGARRVIAVSRFSDPGVRALLAAAGVQVVSADLSDPDVLQALPDAANVIYMAGQKFGTRDAPARTWHTNVVVPALAARRYRDVAARGVLHRERLCAEARCSRAARSKRTTWRRSASTRRHAWGVSGCSSMPRLTQGTPRRADPAELRRGPPVRRAGGPGGAHPRRLPDRPADRCVQLHLAGRRERDGAVRSCRWPRARRSW